MKSIVVSSLFTIALAHPAYVNCDLSFDRNGNSGSLLTENQVVMGQPTEVVENLITGLTENTLKIGTDESTSLDMTGQWLVRSTCPGATLSGGVSKDDCTGDNKMVYSAQAGTVEFKTGETPGNCELFVASAQGYGTVKIQKIPVNVEALTSAPTAAPTAGTTTSSPENTTTTSSPENTTTTSSPENTTTTTTAPAPTSASPTAAPAPTSASPTASPTAATTTSSPENTTNTTTASPENTTASPENTTASPVPTSASFTIVPSAALFAATFF